MMVPRVGTCQGWLKEQFLCSMQPGMAPVPARLFQAIYPLGRAQLRNVSPRGFSEEQVKWRTSEGCEL